MALKIGPLFETASGPLLLEPRAHGSSSLLEAVGPNVADVRQRLLEHGVLLFRGFRVSGVQEFEEFSLQISSRHFKYIHRSSPRQTITDRVLTATHYPQQLEIPLHNENAYQDKWPLMIAFYCGVAPMKGGETPFACMKTISEQVGGKLMDKFEQSGVEYVRHYHLGVDLSWQDVFQTDSRAEVDNYCRDNGIQSTWLNDSLLRTSNVAQGVAYHPVTGQRTFFNQAHLFHASSLGTEEKEALTTLFGEDRLPRHARFGNGQEIQPDELREVRQAFASNALSFRWQPGDVLLIDNMQYCHGRRSYAGKRAVFATLMDPHP